MSLIPLKNEDLATYLAATLTDLEFELLVRKRIEFQFEAAHSAYPNTDFCTSRNECSFRFRWEDSAEWNVSLGSSYRDSTSARGEVLAITVRTCLRAWMDQHANKLSLLLEGPPSESSQTLDTSELTEHLTAVGLKVIKFD